MVRWQEWDKVGWGSPSTCPPHLLPVSLITYSGPFPGDPKQFIASEHPSVCSSDPLCMLFPWLVSLPLFSISARGWREGIGESAQESRWVMVPFLCCRLPLLPPFFALGIPLLSCEAEAVKP